MYTAVGYDLCHETINLGRVIEAFPGSVFETIARDFNAAKDEASKIKIKEAFLNQQKLRIHYVGDIVYSEKGGLALPGGCFLGFLVGDPSVSGSCETINLSEVYVQSRKLLRSIGLSCPPHYEVVRSSDSIMEAQK